MVARNSILSPDSVAVINYDESSGDSTTSATGRKTTVEGVHKGCIRVHKCATEITLVIATLQDNASYNPAMALLRKEGWQEMDSVEVGGPGSDG